MGAQSSLLALLSGQAPQVSQEMQNPPRGDTDGDTYDPI
jgi:hypothetical protein